MVEKRVYQVWKGSNRFLFSGRLIFGPDVRSLVAGIFLIISPVIVFCIFVARNLFHSFPTENSGVAVPIIAVVLTIWVLTLLLLTSSRDPGIVPRSAHPPEPEEYDDSGVSPADWSGGRTPRSRLPRTKDVIVNGAVVKTKYCDTCMLYRPPRCSHCSICNNCVERFDHHCPWVGQCIGKRNYRFFFMFVSSATVLCIYVFAFSALYINFLMKGDSHTTVSRNLWKAIGKSPASIVLIVYSFIAVWFVGGLTLFHLYLIATNQTTYENFRYRYDNRENVFNQGIVKNFQDIFCSRIEPSKNDFRAKVQVDTSGRIVTSPLPVSGSERQAGDIEAAEKLGMPEMNEARGHVGEAGDDALELSEGGEASFAHMSNRRLPVESSEITMHPRRSSWGRKSDNWDINSDVLSVAMGHADSDRSSGDKSRSRQ